MRARAGFTLIETLLVVAVFALIMAALATLVLRYDGFLREQAASVGAGSDAGAVVNEVERLVLEADRVPFSHAFAGSTYESTTSTLVLEIPSVSSSGDAIKGSYDYAAVYLSQGAVYRLFAASAGSARASGVKKLAAPIASLSFSYDAPPPDTTSVEVEVTAQRGNGTGSTSRSLSGKANLRNL